MEVTILLYCFAAILLVITLQIWIVEYLSGPIFKREVLENMPTPLFEPPLKFIAHGCILRDNGR